MKVNGDQQGLKLTFSATGHCGRWI